ncbi:MAG: hypothetical protein AAGE05_03200 [Pseudomonadota bacterium]
MELDQEEIDEIGDPWILSDSDFRQSVTLARQGDPDASFDLYMHLEVGGENYSNIPESSTHWLEQAAESGRTDAQQHRLSRYFWDPDAGHPNAESCRNAFSYMDREDIREKIDAGEIPISPGNIEECEQILGRSG